MLILLPTLLALFSVAISATIAIRARASARSLVSRITVPSSDAPQARAIVASTRRRMILAVVLGALAAVGCLMLPLDHLGSALVFAPAVGAVIALLVIAISPTPYRPFRVGLRFAELTPRGAATFGPRWGFVVPLIATALLVSLLITTGMSAVSDDGGLPRAIYVAVPHGSNEGTPYPGWYYGVPILAASAVLVAVTLVALHRVAAAPRIGPADLPHLDGAVRAALTRFVMLVATAVILLYLGGVSLFAAETLRTTSQWAQIKPSILDSLHATGGGVIPANAVIHGVVQPFYTVGAVGVLFGIILIGIAILVALLAVTNVGIRSSAVTASEAQKVHA